MRWFFLFWKLDSKSFLLHQKRNFWTAEQVQFNVLKSSHFSASTVFVCNGSGFEPYKDSYNKTRLADEKHHIKDNLGSRYQMMKDYLVSF